jgi:hypothetical protein
MIRSLFVIVLLNITYLGLANNFKKKAKLDSISSDGFYKIILPPEVISDLNSEYSDLRIYNSKNKEVPYIIVKENSHTLSNYYCDYPIVENYITPDGKYSRIKIRNPEKTVRTDIHLIIRNTDLEKEIVVKGSDDNKNWYIISKGFPERMQKNEGDTTETRIIRFPSSNYAFFELIIKNEKGERFQIIRTSYINREIVKGAYTCLPLPKIKQTDSAKKSFITLIFEKPFNINRIEWEIKNPAFYLRNCSLGKFSFSAGVKKFQPLGNYILSSKFEPIWEFPVIKTDSLMLVIENEDNPPVSFAFIKALQLNIYMIVHLEKGERYTLFWGNANLPPPDYDLKYFTRNISPNLPVIGIQKTEKLNNNLELKSKPSLLFNHFLLWGVILLVAFGLGYVTIKLIKDLK